MAKKEIWSRLDSRRALREGWDVFSCDGNRIGDFILKLDDPTSVADGWPHRPAFSTDGDAVRFVVFRAAVGSRLHARALRIHKRSESRL